MIKPATAHNIEKSQTRIYLVANESRALVLKFQLVVSNRFRSIFYLASNSNIAVVENDHSRGRFVPFKMLCPDCATLGLCCDSLRLVGSLPPLGDGSLSSTDLIIQSVALDETWLYACCSPAPINLRRKYVTIFSSLLFISGVNAKEASYMAGPHKGAVSSYCGYEIIS